MRGPRGVRHDAGVVRDGQHINEEGMTMKFQVKVGGDWLDADTNVDLAGNVWRNLMRDIGEGKRSIGVSYLARGIEWRMVRI